MPRFLLPGEPGYSFGASFPALLNKGFQLAGQVGFGLPLYNLIGEVYEEMDKTEVSRLVGIIGSGSKAAKGMFGGEAIGDGVCAGCPSIPGSAFAGADSSSRYMILAHAVATMLDGTEKVSNFSYFADEESLGIDSDNPFGQQGKVKKILDEINKQAEENTVDQSPAKYTDISRTQTFVYFVGAKY